MDITPWPELQELLPPLSQYEREQLKSSIAQDGVKIEVLVMEDGRIIEGHHRWAICRELGIETPYRVECCTEQVGFVLGVELNTKRRQLSLEQEKEIADKLRSPDVGLTQEQVARLLGKGQQTVSDWESGHNTDSGNMSTSPRDTRIKVPSTEHSDIYDRCQAGEAHRTIAADYHVSTKTIQRIKAKEQRRLDREAEQQEQADSPELDTSIKLYCADSPTFITTLNDDSISLVVTDPPYNTTGYDWDQIGTPSEYLDWTWRWLKALSPKLKEQYHLFVFCAPEYQADIEHLLRGESWPIKSRIIWEYRNLVKGRDVKDKFIVNYQVVFHCGTHALNWPADWDDRRFSVQHFAAPQSNFDEGKFHPMQKPLELIKLFVQLGSSPGDVVLDLFAGSGTTGLACQQVGQRECVLIEQSDEYCSVIEKRLGVEREQCPE